MASGSRSIWRLSRRALALLAALALAMTTAAAELIDPALYGEALAGEDVTGETVAAEENYFTSPTINMDADLRMGYVASSVEEINPLSCTQRDLVSLNMLVFESVVELDDNMKPVPLLADSWKKKGNTWTFTLRSGIVFHNGAPLTAEQVVASYKRFAQVDKDNPYYSRVALIKSMESVDDLTLRVTFRGSGYAVLYGMTFPVIESSTVSDVLPRGTGPYWYTEYYTGIGVRLEANPLWWKNDPEVHSIAAINYGSPGDALEALRTNEINILCTQSSKAAVNRKLSDLTCMDYATNNYEMLIPNLQNSSVMSDIRMRQAVMYALDRASIAENAYLGMGVQCEVPVNPASWLYESQSAIYYYSPERALQLLLDCGWKDLTGDGMLNKINDVILQDLTVHIITYNESTNNIRENAADLVAMYLQQVGINAKVTVYSKTKCLQEMRDYDYDLALVGIQLSDLPLLSPLLQARGSLNMNNFRNDNMELLLNEVSTAQSEEALRSAFSQIQMIVVDRLPLLGLLFRTGSVLSKRSLGGLSGLRVGDMLNGIEYMTNCFGAALLIFVIPASAAKTSRRGNCRNARRCARRRGSFSSESRCCAGTPAR